MQDFRIGFKRNSWLTLLVQRQHSKGVCYIGKVIGNLIRISQNLRLYGTHARVRHATQAKAAREVPRIKIRILLWQHPTVYAPQSEDASKLQGIQHAHCGGNYSQEERRLDSCFWRRKIGVGSNKLATLYKHFPVTHTCRHTSSHKGDRTSIWKSSLNLVCWRENTDCEQL